MEKHRLKIELDRRQRTVSASKNRFSKKRIDPKDHDAKGKVDLARLSGKDRGAADNYKQMQSRVERLDTTIALSGKTGERKTGLRLFGSIYKGDIICSEPVL
jgi:hypothetical protein